MAFLWIQRPQASTTLGIYFTIASTVDTFVNINTQVCVMLGKNLYWYIGYIGMLCKNPKMTFWIWNFISRIEKKNHFFFYIAEIEINNSYYFKIFLFRAYLANLMPTPLETLNKTSFKVCTHIKRKIKFVWKRHVIQCIFNRLMF